jgi:hypothetical protein
MLRFSGLLTSLYTEARLLCVRGKGCGIILLLNTIAFHGLPLRSKGQRQPKWLCVTHLLPHPKTLCLGIPPLGHTDIPSVSFKRRDNASLELFAPAVEQNPSLGFPAESAMASQKQWLFAARVQTVLNILMV